MFPNYSLICQPGWVEITQFVTMKENPHRKPQKLHPAVSYPYQPRQLPSSEDEGHGAQLPGQRKWCLNQQALKDILYMYVFYIYVCTIYVYMYSLCMSACVHKRKLSVYLYLSVFKDVSIHLSLSIIVCKCVVLKITHMSFP